MVLIGENSWPLETLIKICLSERVFNMTSLLHRIEGHSVFEKPLDRIIDIIWNWKSFGAKQLFQLWSGLTSHSFIWWAQLGKKIYPESNLLSIISSKMSVFSKWNIWLEQRVDIQNCMWGVLSRMVSIVGNGIRDLSSNPRRRCLCFTLSLGKAWIHRLSLQLWGNSRQIEFFSFGKTTKLGEGKLWIQISCTLLKSYYIIAERFFLYYHFSLVISYHSV